MSKQDVSFEWKCFCGLQYRCKVAFDPMFGVESCTVKVLGRTAFLIFDNRECCGGYQVLSPSVRPWPPRRRDYDQQGREAEMLALWDAIDLAERLGWEISKVEYE